MSELSAQGGSERYGACEDAAAGAAEQPLLAAALLNLRGGCLYLFTARLDVAVYTLFVGRDDPARRVGAAPCGRPKAPFLKEIFLRRVRRPRRAACS